MASEGTKLDPTSQGCCAYQALAFSAVQCAGSCAWAEAKASAAAMGMIAFNFKGCLSGGRKILVCMTLVDGRGFGQRRASAVALPRYFRLRASSSSSVRGQSDFISFERLRSASTLPPVWHRAQ